jgi:Zn-dependent protease
MMAVALAGPATNLVLATLGAVGLGLIGANPSGVLSLAWTELYWFVLINIFLAVFNLLPIPPFDGSHVVEGLLPPRAAQVYARLGRIGIPLVLLALVVVPSLFPNARLVERVLVPPAGWVDAQLMALAAWIENLI